MGRENWHRLECIVQRTRQSFSFLYRVSDRMKGPKRSLVVFLLFCLHPLQVGFPLQFLACGFQTQLVHTFSPIGTRLASMRHKIRRPLVRTISFSLGGNRCLVTHLHSGTWGCKKRMKNSAWSWFILYVLALCERTLSPNPPPFSSFAR